MIGLLATIYLMKNLSRLLIFVKEIIRRIEGPNLSVSHTLDTGYFQDLLKDDWVRLSFRYELFRLKHFKDTFS